MAVPGADHVHVEVELAPERGGLPELLDEREGEFARDEKELLVDRRLENEERSAGEVDDRSRQGLVERHEARAKAFDSRARSERLIERLAEREADVLDGVMGVDVHVAGRADREIDARMFRNRLEHVGEKPDGRFNVRSPRSVESQREGHRRLLRLPLDRAGPAHNTSRSASRNRSFSAREPIETRRRPGAAVVMSRTRTPLSRSARRTRPAWSPGGRTKTKFAEDGATRQPAAVSASATRPRSATISRTWARATSGCARTATASSSAARSTLNGRTAFSISRASSGEATA